MDTTAKTITTMGIISDRVYNQDQGKNYFQIGATLEANGTTYKVIDQENTSNDMQALLLEETKTQSDGTVVKTGKYVVAFRGTQEILDALVDAVIGFGNINAQYAGALAFVQKALDNPNYNITTSNLTLTGHSLGGILTQQVGATLDIKGYAFNPYGVDRMLTTPINPIGWLDAITNVAIFKIMAAVGLDSSKAAWAKENILNVSYTDMGLFNGDPLSNIVTNLTSEHMGAFLPIVNADVDPALGHKMTLLNGAIASYNIILSHFANKDDYLSLSKAYFSTGSYEKTEKIFNDVGVYQGSGLKFNFLQNATASYIATQAKSDSAVLYALAKLNPFAIEGNLPAYANLNRTDMTDKYIEDRAQYLYYLLDKTNRYDVDPTLSMTYYADAALGSDYTLSQTFSRSRVLFGGEGKSTLNGGDNGDRLYGMGGDDTLTGNGGDDYMEGGTGYDKYIAGNGDTIMDSDRSGVVLFEGTRLIKGVAKSGECSPDGDGEYKGDGGVYKLSGGKLTFTKNSGETLTIEKFVNGAMGIILTSEDPGGSCPPPPPSPAPGPGTPSPNFPSPLVLDLNGDGVTSTFISSTSTYFDLDNDGVRQRTGWVQSTDALLALDKNQDGIINDAAELFGNHTTLKNGTLAANGFEALKEYDENKDGLIDAKDNIYNTLSLWQDTDSDGVTDIGELHTLTELGVKSINLGYTQTTDYEEQNRIFQTSGFTVSRHPVLDTGSSTTSDEVHIINDVWFATESRDTARDTNVTLKDSVAALPDFRGAGRAGNLSAAMNEIKIEREVA